MDELRRVISDNPVVIFTKTNCAYCAEAERILRALGAAPHIVNAFKDNNGAALRAELKEKTNHTTFPYVFVGSDFVGGCAEVKQLSTSGQLQGKLAAAGALRDASGSSDSSDPQLYRPFGSWKARLAPALFRFPHTVDGHVVRVSGVLTCFTSIALGICGGLEQRWAHYATAAFFADFVLRFWAGSRASAIGTVAQLICARWKPDWRNGPSKQFATFVGTMMTAMGTAFFFGSIEEGALRWIGMACLLILAFFAGLEGFLDFCAGCWMFSIAIRLGLVRDSVYHVHVHEKGSQMAAWMFYHTNYGLGEPEEKVHRVRGHAESEVDAKYKVKTEEHRLNGFGPIKHCKLMFFMIPLSIAALAIAFKEAAEGGSDLEVDDTTWHTVGLIAAGTWFVLAVLTMARAVMYPHKIWTELDCLERGNFAAVPFMCLLLFAALIPTDSGEVAKGMDGLARALYWIGFVPTFLVAATRVTKWMSHRFTLDHVSPSYLIAPVGLLLATLASGAVETLEGAGGENLAYSETGFFAYGFAAFSAAVLLPLTFHAYVMNAHGNDAMRFGAWIWAAALAVLSIATDVVTGSFMGVVARLFFFAGFALSLALILATFSGYLGRGKWTPEWWATGFPVAAVAATLVRYHKWLLLNTNRTGFSEWLAWGGLAVASALLVLHALWTLVELAKGKMFVSLPPFAAISIMKLTHDAIRGAEARIKGLAEGAGSHPAAHAELATEARMLATIMAEHSKHEDTVVFKEVSDILPGAMDAYEKDHEEIDKVVERLFHDAEGLRKGGGAAKSVEETIKELYKVTLPHLQQEEENIQQLVRKHLPLALQKQLVRRVWEATPPATWMEIIPWVVNNLPREDQRVKYLRGWMDAMPERCHQIGRFVYLGTSASAWATLRVQVPEMVPRGAPGWFHLW
ncbi:unnamed protein product [Pedinophyceae sp. YPF-701]|nr:unnamed protein product [Pedinophyceae sp. YPF-701]